MLVKNAKSIKLMERKKDFFKQHCLEWKDVFFSLLEICVDKDFYVEWEEQISYVWCDSF